MDDILTPVEAAGVRACIQAFGETHPSAKVLSQFLVEGCVSPEFGSADEMRSGVLKGIEQCKQQNVPCINPENLRHVLNTDARGSVIERCEDQPKTTNTTREDT